jgi:hypothetical protein
VGPAPVGTGVGGLVTPVLDGTGVGVAPMEGVAVMVGLAVGVTVMLGVGVGVGVAPPRTKISVVGGIPMCIGRLIDVITRVITIRVLVPCSIRTSLRTICEESIQARNLVMLMPLFITDRKLVCICEFRLPITLESM